MNDKKIITIDESSLPKGWSVATLEDVTEYIQRGKGPQYIDKSDLPVINQKCIRWFGIQKEHLKYVHHDQWDKWAEERYVRVGDILWNSTGTGTIGRAALIKHLEKNEKYVVDSHVTIVRPKDVSSQYVHYWIMSPAVQGSIEDMQSGSTNQVELSKGAVQSTPIPLAPPDQQKRIVAEIEKQFSRLDKAIANLKRVKINLKRYKAAVLKATIEGKLTEEWRKANSDVEPADKLLQRVSTSRNKWIEIETSKGNSEAKRLKTKLKNHRFTPPEDIELPKEWEWASFLTASKLVVDCHNKTAPYENSGIKLLRTTNIRDGKIDLHTSKYISQETYEYWSRRCPPEPGDILFTREAPMGEAAIIPEGAKICMGQRMMLIRLFDNLVSTKYFLYTILSPTFQSRLGHGAVGSGVKHLRVGDVESLTVPIPPIDEQHEIVNHVESKLSVILEIDQEIDSNMQRVERLRQSILSMAFSGKLIFSNNQINDENNNQWQMAHTK